MSSAANAKPVEAATGATTTAAPGASPTSPSGKKQKKKKQTYVSVGINRLSATGGISVLATIQDLARRKFADMEDIQPFGSHRGCSALWVASYKGHLEVVMFLLKDPRVNPAFVEQDYGWTILHAAASQGHTLVMRELLADKRTIVDFKDKQMRTPLILAAEWGRVGALRLLLLCGSGKNLRDAAERTAYDVAKYRQKPAEAIALLKGKSHSITGPRSNSKSRAEVRPPFLTFFSKISAQIGPTTATKCNLRTVRSM